MPTTLDALLMCGACDRATLHLFHEARVPAETPGAAADDQDYLELIYVCEECETERVWGNELMVTSEAGRRAARQEHAIGAHGARMVDCPLCHGEGLDCTECGDRGEIWILDNAEPCGPGCPLGDGERA